MMRRLLIGEAVDRLIQGNPPTRPQDARELREGTALGADVGKDGSRRHDVHGGSVDRSQVLRGRLDEPAAIEYVQLLGERAVVAEEVAGNVAEDDLALAADAFESAEGDQTVAGADV